MKTLIKILSIIILSSNLLLAQDTLTEEQIYQLQIDSIEQSFNYQYGDIKLGDNLATLSVPKGYKFLDSEQSNYVLTDLWGNPPSEVMGLLFPEDITPVSDNFTYAVEITYSEDGYIDDDDAKDLDYDDLLEEMQNDAEEVNEERIKQGYDPIEFVGWASEPYYDQENKKLHWAKELRFGEADINTLNYNIRILGRKGYLNLNAIGDINVLPVFNKDINQILSSVEFNQGNRYSDFNPDLDEVAAYGIGGLIAGKILTKAGFFATILKFWKVGFLAIAGLLAAFRKKIFGAKEA